MLNNVKLDEAVLARAMLRKRITSVEELAALAGVNANDIGGGFWEEETDLTVILKLADVLDIEPDSLVADERGKHR